MTLHDASEGPFPTNKERASTVTLLSPEVYFKMLLHAFRYAHPERNSEDWVEVIGLLTGTVTNPNTPTERLFVTQAWPIGHGSAVGVTINNYGKVLTRVLEEKEEGTEILGWYHTHPGYGVWMSHTDYRTHLSYQRMYDRAVAVVLDPTLVSSLYLGFEVFRLELPRLNRFEVLRPAITDNFSPKTIPALVKHLAQKAMTDGLLDELDH